MTLYITGIEGALEVAPRFRIEKWDGKPRVRFITAQRASLVFRIVRGRCEEFRTHFDNKRTFAREIPGEAMQALEDVERRLAEARATLADLENEKQAFLEALAPRCQLAKIDEVMT